MTVTPPRPRQYPLGRSAPGPAAEALARARDHLLGLQHDQGWWQGELETNVTMDAEDLLLREFLGVRTAEQTQAAARWIASQQRDDGTWEFTEPDWDELRSVVTGHGPRSQDRLAFRARYLEQEKWVRDTLLAA